ncbi:hypothetical protein PGTUg99_037201 [Puccinia graminis f. sp. tritici]|uniref:Uncharacterized protein n=1 Tax=Puccinia graminis f. sp. tritici TaxID=56615 RepID=A0A5B0RBC8_PUCGR|nr:hypothetical protein PGTUg99_037201 [Puccinia graminis f. sp. tritici]
MTYARICWLMYRWITCSVPIYQPLSIPYGSTSGILEGCVAGILSTCEKCGIRPTFSRFIPPQGRAFFSTRHVFNVT